MASGRRSSDPVEPTECALAEPDSGDAADGIDSRWRDDRAQPGERDEPERELWLDVDCAERGVLFEWLLERLLERERDTDRGDSVRECRREPDVDRERERDGTDADEGERDRERDRLLLGGVRESDRDRDRLGDRL